MAVSSVLEKVSVNLILNNGTKDGKIKTISLSLGGLNTQRYEGQKAMNVADLLGTCLSKPVLEVRKVEVSTMTAGE